MKAQFLNKINSPDDLKKVSVEDLNIVCNELRNFLIDSVSVNPGHFGAGLGVIELTVALHYVFNSPKDKIIWDVGHQAYAHKIITGRKDLFHTNRKKGGISGFPKPEESIHDSFATGHASTSISAASGMAVANKLNGKNDKVIAIIGDGALSGGMAFEALNNAGKQNLDMLIILNDNNMSIDPSVGALNDYLLDSNINKTFNKLKDDVWRYIRKTNVIEKNKITSLSDSINTAIKDLVINHSIFFEALNFQYFGRIDGHNVKKLVETLQHISKISGPKILHIKTIKGKGFKEAEKNQTIFHAPGTFDKHTGSLIKKENNKPKYQEVFGKTIVKLASKNKKITGITPAMPTGSSLNIMMEKFPERAFDVGIAEQHAVTFAAGMAASGLKPFCVIYSTFLQRSYDQIIHDVCLQKLPVVFCIDRAGLVGEDGETHQGAYDLAYLRTIPNIVISAPIDEIEMQDLMFTASNYFDSPFSIRYPRDYGEYQADINHNFKPIEIGKAQKVFNGNDVVVLSIGTIGNEVKKAIKKVKNKTGKSIGFVNMRFLKPIDTGILFECFTNYNTIISIEDGSIKGGLGSEIAEFKSKHNFKNKHIILGIQDKFIPHATRQEQLKMCGIDSESIAKVLEDNLF